MVSPPPKADEPGQGEAEALPMHALAIAPSQAADAQPTANGTVSSPNGEAAREPAPAETLVAGGSSPAAVDTALSDALREEKNRETVLGFEAAVEELLADEHRQEMKFESSLTGYQRLLAHRVAQYYGLDTSTYEGPGEDKGRIQAVKTAHTRAPKLRLADLAADKGGADAAAAAEAPKLLRKKAQGQHAVRHGLANGDAGRAAARAPAERLQEYERTRQRIFSAADAAPAANGGGRGGRGGRGAGGEAGPERMGAPAGRGRGGFPGPAGGKAQMRNRDEERRDPDFLRDHSRYQPQFAPGFGEHAAQRQGAYIPARTYSSEFPRMAAGPGPAGGLQRGGGMPTPFGNGMPHAAGAYAGNGARAAYGVGGAGGRGAGGAPPMMAVPVNMGAGPEGGGYMGLPGHGGVGALPGYPPMQLPYALVPGQGMQAMQGYGMYAPGGMALGGVPLAPGPGMGFAYLQPQRPGGDAHAHAHPMSALGHAALGGQAPMAGMALPPGAIPMFPGYAPGGYGLPLQVLQGLPQALRGRAPARPLAPVRRASGGPGLQRHQRTNSGGSAASTATSQRGALSQPPTPQAADAQPAKPAPPAPEPPACAAGADAQA